jgi:hypothetical protein
MKELELPVSVSNTKEQWRLCVVWQSWTDCGSIWIWQLCDLYENDSIFDKFECCLSGDGERVATGSYRYVCFCFLCNASKEFCWRLEST